MAIPGRLVKVQGDYRISAVVAFPFVLVMWPSSAIAKYHMSREDIDLVGNAIVET